MKFLCLVVQSSVATCHAHPNEAWKDTVQLAAECLGEDGSEDRWHRMARLATDGARMCQDVLLVKIC
jgi:hypothetical protein